MKFTIHLLLTILLLSMVAACGGGDNENSQKPAIEDNGDEQTETEQEDTPSPDPDEEEPGPASPELTQVETCPANAATSVGWNSLINIRAEMPFDASTINADSIQVSCNSSNVEGILSVEGNLLTFTPAETLPVDAHCIANTDEALSDIEGRKILNGSWEFTVGSADDFQWDFSEPVQIGDTGYSLGIQTMRYGNKLIVTYGRGTDLYVSVSEDFGKTFTTSEPLRVLHGTSAGLGTLGEVDAVIDETGVLHLFWSLVPVNHPVEILYAHSTGQLTEFTSPKFVSSPYDGFRSVSPDLAVGPDGRLFFTWEDECIDLLCPSEGIRLLILDSSGTNLLHYEELADKSAGTPKVESINDQMIISWVQQSPTGEIGDWDKVIRLFNYDTGMNQIAEVYVDYSTVFDKSLVQGPGNSGFLFWAHGIVEDKRYYVSQLDGVTLTATEPELVYAVDGQFSRHCAYPVLDENHNTAWYVGGIEEPLPHHELVNPVRTLSFSREGNDSTFGLTAKFDFLLPYKQIPPVGKYSDSVCPSVAINSKREIFAAWTRAYTPPGNEGRVYRLMASYGKPERPCFE